MHARSDIDKKSVIVFGRSLGGAVAVYLAETAPSKVCVVMSLCAFDTYPEC